MKRRVCVVVGIVLGLSIMTGIMLSMKMTNKNVQDTEKIGKVEEIQEESHKQALEGEPQIPETWDLNKVTPVLSEDNIYVPVPKGFTGSKVESERYVNGNVNKKGTLSNLTFSSTGPYPWTQNSNNIWMSGNYQVPNSTSELVSNEITVGAGGGYIEIEWSVCSESGRDNLIMEATNTANGTTEVLKEITGNKYGTTESSLIYTKYGKELNPGTYTINIKYSKYNNTTHTGLDKGYVKTGTYFDYDENGVEQRTVHKATGFVIYEGIEEVNSTNVWESSKTRNQFVWVPVINSSRIYDENSTTKKIKAKLYDFTSIGRNQKSNSNTDNKSEPGIITHKAGDNIRFFTNMQNVPGYTKDTFYKEIEIEYKKTVEAIKEYGGFYIGRYETGIVNSNVLAVRRMPEKNSKARCYEEYQRIKNLSTNPNIQTVMIWGSLWDETLEWIIETGEKSRVEMMDSTSWGNYRNSTFKYYNANGELANTSAYASKELPTGSSERNKANNIYDLAGNTMEWTLEKKSDSSSDRLARGGNEVEGYDRPASNRWIYNFSYSPSNWRFTSLHVYQVKRSNNKVLN